MRRRPPRVAILATGGTIASASTPTGAQPSLSARELAAHAVPAGVEVVEVRDLMHVLSPALTPGDMWDVVTEARKIAATAEVDGIVVTHGTATLQETAYLADLVWELESPIVFTGAMIPGADPSSDGPRNLADAIRVAAAPAARKLGSLVVAAGQIHAARDVVKTHKSAVGTFASVNFGTLGIVDEGTVIVGRLPTLRRTYSVRDLVTQVDLLKAFSGMDDAYLRFALERGARGLVIECFPGRGGLPPHLLPAIQDATARGVPVVLSGAAEGRVSDTYGGPAGTKTFLEAGAISAGDLAPVKARMLLMVALALPDASVASVREEFAAACP